MLYIYILKYIYIYIYIYIYYTYTYIIEFRQQGFIYSEEAQCTSDVSCGQVLITYVLSLSCTCKMLALVSWIYII